LYSIGNLIAAQSAVPQAEVILRDFDGTRTVYKTEAPLRRLIAMAQSDMQVTVNKIYVRTEETDERGRIIYAEQN
jgi:hypothetical protein